MIDDDWWLMIDDDDDDDDDEDRLIIDDEEIKSANSNLRSSKQTIFKHMNHEAVYVGPTWPTSPGPESLNVP